MRTDLTSAQKELQAKENEMELRNAKLVAQANECPKSPAPTPSPRPKSPAPTPTPKPKSPAPTP